MIAAKVALKKTGLNQYKYYSPKSESEIWRTKITIIQIILKPIGVIERSTHANIIINVNLIPNELNKL